MRRVVPEVDSDHRHCAICMCAHKAVSVLLDRILFVYRSSGPTTVLYMYACTYTYGIYVHTSCAHMLLCTYMHRAKQHRAKWNRVQRHRAQQFRAVSSNATSNSDRERYCGLGAGSSSRQASHLYIYIGLHPTVL